jgi:hypothetical protein
MVFEKAYIFSGNQGMDQVIGDLLIIDIRTVFGKYFAYYAPVI